MRPHTIVLAVDQGAKSGFCIMMNGEYFTSGVAKNVRDRQKAVKEAQNLAMCRKFPLMVVYEDHSGIPARKRGNTRTILGMGAAQGRWDEHLDLEGHRKSLRRKVRPETWRAQVLGLRLFTPRADAKAAAVEFCKATHGIDVTHDEAEAICIGHYGNRLTDTQWAA